MYEVGKLSHLLSPVNGEDRPTGRSKEDFGVLPNADAAPKQYTPRSLTGFIEWLADQPPEKSYCYISFKDCAYAQYARACGVSYFDAGAPGADRRIAVTEPWTFGALLSRALKAQAASERLS